MEPPSVADQFRWSCTPAAHRVPLSTAAACEAQCPRLLISNLLAFLLRLPHPALAVASMVAASAPLAAAHAGLVPQIVSLVILVIFRLCYSRVFFLGLPVIRSMPSYVVHFSPCALIQLTSACVSFPVPNHATTHSRSSNISFRRAIEVSALALALLESKV